MKPTMYVVVSGIIFGLIAVAQEARLLFAWPVLVGNRAVPGWLSLVVLIAASVLCAWAFYSRATLRAKERAR